MPKLISIGNEYITRVEIDEYISLIKEFSKIKKVIKQDFNFYYLENKYSEECRVKLLRSEELKQLSECRKIATELGIGKDPGYLAFQKIVQIFTSEYQVFLFVIAIIFFSALGNFIYKNTTRLNDAIIAFFIYSVLFYSFFSITGHRQTIATAATLGNFRAVTD